MVKLRMATVPSQPRDRVDYLAGNGRWELTCGLHLSLGLPAQPSGSSRLNHLPSVPRSVPGFARAYLLVRSHVGKIWEIPSGPVIAGFVN